MPLMKSAGVMQSTELMNSTELKKSIASTNFATTVSAIGNR
jgi:hypothetical protein